MKTFGDLKMNKFKTQLEMVTALFVENETIVDDNGRRYFVDIDRLCEITDECRTTNILPNFQDCKIFIERWHDGLNMNGDGDFDDAILCHVCDDIRLVTGYCEKSDRYILIDKNDCYGGEYANADNVNPVTFNDVSRFIKK
jgi:hypothetical protein